MTQLAAASHTHYGVPATSHVLIKPKMYCSIIADFYRRLYLSLEVFVNSFHSYILCVYWGQRGFLSTGGQAWELESFVPQTNQSKEFHKLFRIIGLKGPENVLGKMTLFAGKCFRS